MERRNEFIDFLRGGGQSCWFYGDIVFRDVIQIHLTYFDL